MLPLPSKYNKKKTQALLNQLIAALEAYNAFLTEGGTPEEAELDDDLRATNMNMSIYDPCQVLYDMQTLRDRKEWQL